MCVSNAAVKCYKDDMNLYNEGCCNGNKVRLDFVFICYSAFEVSCPDCNLKSALDHVARDEVMSRYMYTVRVQLSIFCKSCTCPTLGSF